MLSMSDVSKTAISASPDARLAEIFPLRGEVPAAMACPSTQPRVLIGGEIRLWEGRRRDVGSPLWLREAADGQPSPTVLGQSAQLSPDEALQALSAARSAWARGAGRWPTLRLEERVEAVERFTAAMIAVRDRVCRLLMWEVGKTWTDSQAEFDRTVQYIRDTVEALKTQDRDNSRLQFREGIIAQVRRAPLGVTLCMGPFNYPLNETFATLIPALIMGNTVVVKLPRFGVLLWDPLLEAFAEAFPPGVVNIINGQGSEIIPPLMQTGHVDVLAFIGSSKAADAIKGAHPRLHRLRCILGLDAKNPAVILPDADLATTISECIKGALSFNGQRCTALKIFFVHKAIAERFTAALCDAVAKLPQGMPWVPGARLTPLVEPDKASRLNGYVRNALSLGARLENGVDGEPRHAYTAYHPAVLSGVTPAMSIYHEEQFGPILPIVTINDVAEFTDYMLDTTYGQQASLFGQDESTLGRLIDVLSTQVCRINLNSQCQRGPDVFPFTGRKSSAEGTLSVGDALRSFSIRSMVAANGNPAGKALVRAILDHSHSNFLNTDIIL
jgi:glyceraldehyde-3-phosphate dehydrogenase (NADP+)